MVGWMPGSPSTTDRGSCGSCRVNTRDLRRLTDVVVLIKVRTRIKPPVKFYPSWLRRPTLLNCMITACVIFFSAESNDAKTIPPWRRRAASPLPSPWPRASCFRSSASALAWSVFVRASALSAVASSASALLLSNSSLCSGDVSNAVSRAAISAAFFVSERPPFDAAATH